jgi:hypothetical protein
MKKSALSVTLFALAVFLHFWLLTPQKPEDCCGLYAAMGGQAVAGETDAPLRNYIYEESNGLIKVYALDSPGVKPAALQAGQTNPIFLKAILSNIDVPKYWRTYFPSGSNVQCWACFNSASTWGVPLDGTLTMTVNFKFAVGSYVREWNDQVLLNANYVSIGDGDIIPANIPDGTSGTLTVNVTIPGYTVVLGGDGVTSAPALNQITFDVANDAYADIKVTSRNGPDVSQTNGSWQGDPLGDCADNSYMWNKGSATTCKAFLFDCLGGIRYNTIPGWLNSWLRDSGGYTSCGSCNGCCPTDEVNAQGVPLNQLCAPDNVKFEGCVQNNVSLSFAKIERYVAGGIPVMIQTTKNGLYYVVVVGLRASGDWDIFDPWDGQLHIMGTDGITKDMITKIYFYSRSSIPPLMMLLD